MTTDIELQALLALKSAALRNQEEITKSIQQMNAATTQFQALVRNLPQQVAGGVQSQLAPAVNAAIDNAADRIVSRQETANTKAEVAEQAYNRAARRSFARIAIWSTICFACGIGGMVATAAYILPDYKTLMELQRQKAELEFNIADLERRGGKAIIITCTDGNRSRPCIRTDERIPDSWKRNGETYRIIYGN
jgi:hypothetical protein